MTYVMLMGNWWFGARWFGFQKDPLMKGICYLGVPLESQTTNPNQLIMEFHLYF